MSERSANVWDELHNELDQRVFRDETPRPLIVSFIKRKVFSCLRDGFIDDPEKYFHLYLTGSLTTFQYSDASDVDISLFPDYDKLEEVTGEDDPEEIRKMLILLVTTELDGTDLPGTPHPLQDFVQPVGATPESMFKTGLRSAWDFQTHRWMVPPERDRAHDPYTEFPELFQKAQDVGEKMTILLDHGEIEAARQLYKDIHKKRAEDPSDYSEGNLEYKWLSHKGLFDRLRDEAGMHIANVKYTTAPILENPISYNYVPLTPEELNLGAQSKELFRVQKDNFNKRAKEQGAEGRVSATELAAMFNRYNGSCAYCGGPNASSFDHVIPLSRGGGGDISNLLPAHDQCNNDLGIWDENLESNKGIPKKIKDEWLYPATAAKKEEESSEKMKVIYDFDNDSILLGTTSKKDKPGRDGIVIGEYDGRAVKLFDVAKQWVNANYFKKLWLNSFPSRPIEKIFFDKTEMHTRPNNQMTYTQKLPHLTSAISTQKFVWADGQLATSPKFNDDGTYGNLHHPDLFNQLGYEVYHDPYGEGKYPKGFILGYYSPDHSPPGLNILSQDGEVPSKEELWHLLENHFQKQAGDKYHDGSKWKNYLRNRGVIADFKIADGTILEGKVIDYSDSNLKVEVKGGGEREFDSDFLKQIKFKLLDKRTLAAFKNAVKVDTNYWQEQGLPEGGSYGFIDGHLILSSDHHKAIMGSLINAGWTWDQLMNAEQCWGWFNVDMQTRWNEDGEPVHNPSKAALSITFASDSGYINESAEDKAVKAFQELYHLPIKDARGYGGVTNENAYGTGRWSDNKPAEGYNADIYYTDIPKAPAQ